MWNTQPLPVLLTEKRTDPKLRHILLSATETCPRNLWLPSSVRITVLFCSTYPMPSGNFFFFFCRKKTHTVKNNLHDYDFQEDFNYNYQSLKPACYFSPFLLHILHSMAPSLSFKICNHFFFPENIENPSTYKEQNNVKYLSNEIGKIPGKNMVFGDSNTYLLW